LALSLVSFYPIARQATRGYPRWPWHFTGAHSKWLQKTND